MKTCLFSGVFREKSIEEALKYASEIGFEGVEIRAKEPHISEDTTPKRAKEIKNMAEDYGLTVALLYSFIGGFSTISDDECMEQYEKLKKYTVLLDSLKTDMIKVNCGGPHAFLADEEHFQKAAYWLQKCADLVGRNDKKIVLEIHNGSLVETVDSALKLLKLIDRENVGLIHDAGNMYITDTDYGYKSVKKLGDKLFHVHIKDVLRIEDENLPNSFKNLTKYGEELFRLTLLNKGGADHMPMFKALKQSGYTGFLSMECNVSKPDIEIAKYEYNQVKNMLNRI